jgi:hypothetical protein
MFTMKDNPDNCVPFMCSITSCRHVVLKIAYSTRSLNITFCFVSLIRRKPSANVNWTPFAINWRLEVANGGILTDRQLGWATMMLM